MKSAQTWLMSGNQAIARGAYEAGVTVATTRTASDGFYTISSIRPGRYVLRIAPDQLTRLGLSVDRDASIAAKPDGGFINGIDFVVRRIN